MEQTKFKEVAEKLSKSLLLEGSPVAVKMIEKSEDLNKIYHKGQPVKRLNKLLAACQLISGARYMGRVIAADTQQLSICRLGADSLGVNVDDYAHVYTNSYFQTEQAARSMIDSTPRFEKGKYQSILVGPFQKIPIQPDVVVVYGNAAQILRIVNGYLCNKGGRLKFSASGDAGLCADTVVLPMQTARPHIAIPCNGGRILSLPSLTDIACGIPYSAIHEIIDGMEFTSAKVPITYPPRWQHIDWEPPMDSAVRNFVQKSK